MSAPGPYGSPGGPWAPGSPAHPWAPAHPADAPPPEQPPAPPPPPGPGVVPPFPAPPTEGRSTRLWLALGAGALAVLLCCGGGIAALVGLVVTTPGAVNEQAHAAVRKYLGALQQGDYGAAYDQLCARARRVETREHFVERHRNEPRVTAYQLGNVDINRTPIEVPAQVSYDTGSRTTINYVLEQDSRTATLEVCGVDR
ncbi:Rv0361 family membrane protein [Rhizomonospora bruguierae]|uniref:Rv0361 family membrane protein n=1 Tax=Rhizomonospora bruguierae TaxID=1581705 RepID=UPI00278C81D2|nr:hypothetical protein [Micromonospora sp. NBRC 107566]